MTIAHFHAEETRVCAPPQRCYDLVLAVRRVPEWWPSVRCEPLGPEGTLRVGGRARYRAGFGSWVIEVVRLDPYRRIDLEYIDGCLLGPASWDFAPDGAATRVRYAHRGVRAAATSPADEAVRRLRAMLRTEVLDGLRRVLEAAGSDVSGGDLFAALHTQRAVRRFRPDPIPDGVLREIVAAATRAPSARNAQPWGFLAVRDPAIKAEIGRHYLAAWRHAQAFTAQVDADADIKARGDYADMMRGVDRLAANLDQAPVLVLCCLDATRLGPLADAAGRIRAPQSAYASIYPATQNLMLAARGLGIGSTLTTVVLAAEPALRQLVGLPDHMQIVALIPLGYPVRPFRVTTRRELDAVAFLDRWGTPLPR